MTDSIDTSEREAEEPGLIRLPVRGMSEEPAPLEVPTMNHVASRKLIDLPLGSRFRYVGHPDRTYVLLDCGGCGLVGDEPGDARRVFQGLYSAAESRAEFESMLVELVPVVHADHVPDAGKKIEEANANARRLAACWKVCEGVPTEVLEAQQSGGLPWSVADQIDHRMSLDKLLAALHHAEAWIGGAPHGDNCFVSDHYEGDPGNRCNCGKDGALEAVQDAIAAATGSPT